MHMGVRCAILNIDIVLDLVIFILSGAEKKTYVVEM